MVIAQGNSVFHYNFVSCRVSDVLARLPGLIDATDADFEAGNSERLGCSVHYTDVYR